MWRHRTAALVAFLAGCGTDHGTGSELELELVGTYLTGVHPVTAVVADLDGDGDTDLAVPGVLTEELIVVENDGGQLVWHSPTDMRDGATDIIAVDVDGNGRAELIATHRELASVGVYSIGDDFTLTLIQQIALDGLVTALRASDLDGDGDPDLLVSLFQGDALAVLDNLSGRFGRIDTIPTSHGPFAMRFADLDGDGADEIVVAVGGADRIEVFTEGDSGWVLSLAVETDAWPSWVEVIDIDSDGDLELVGAANQGDRVFAIELDGGPSPYRNIATSDGAFGFVAVDPDSDGELELVLTNKDANTIDVLDSKPGGTLEAVFTVDVGFNTGPSPLYRWDLDNDGTAEHLAVVNAFANEVEVYRWSRAN